MNVPDEGYLRYLYWWTSSRDGITYLGVNDSGTGMIMDIELFVYDL